MSSTTHKSSWGVMLCIDLLPKSAEAQEEETRLSDAIIAGMNRKFENSEHVGRNFTEIDPNFHHHVSHLTGTIADTFEIKIAQITHES